MSNVYVTEPATSGRVVLETTHGPIEIKLWCRECPKVTKMFLQLCMDGYYDNMVFHRIVPKFLIQTGAVNIDHNNKSNNTKAPSERWSSEYKKSILHTQDIIARKKYESNSRIRFNHRGQVAMALTLQDDDQKSNEDQEELLPQFFITLEEAAYLDDKYVIFGTVSGPTMFNAMRIGNNTEINESTNQVIDINDAATITNIKIVENELHTNLVPCTNIPWNNKNNTTKMIKTKTKKKKKRKGKLDINVLSFGDEFNDNDDDHDFGGGDDGKIKKESSNTNIIIKSSHDLLASIEDENNNHHNNNGSKKKKNKRTKKEEESAVKTTTPTILQNGIDNTHLTEKEKTSTSQESSQRTNEETPAPFLLGKAKMVDALTMKKGAVRLPPPVVFTKKNKNDTSKSNNKEGADQKKDEKSTKKIKVSYLEARRSKYMAGGGGGSSSSSTRNGDNSHHHTNSKQKKKQQHRRDEETMEKMFSFRTNVRKQASTTNSTVEAAAASQERGGGLAARMAKRYHEAASTDNATENHTNVASYHGQIMEEDENEDQEDHTSWLQTKFQCKKYVGHQSMEDNSKMKGADGRNMDDYEVIDPLFKQHGKKGPRSKSQKDRRHRR